MFVKPWERQTSFPEFKMEDKFLMGTADDDATVEQRHYIALLADNLGIEEPIEEQAMTRQEASDLIIRLKAAEKGKNDTA